MKNVMMIFIFLGSLALQQVNAQKGCNPCPPGCCIFSCSTHGKGSVAAAPAAQPDLIFAAFNVGDNPGCNRMTKKEVKSCLASCQGAPNDNAHTADAALSAGHTDSATSAATPACHPVCLGPTACKTTGSSAASSEASPPSRVKEKG